jgi:hypothetical protein
MNNTKEKFHELILPAESNKAEKYKDELNFAEFPLASLADHVPAEQKTLTFVDTIFDQGSNKPVTRKLTITASDKYGLPRALDEEVILGLIQLTNRQGFKEKKVHFSSYELIKLLGWNDSAKSYKRIEEALNRWISITLFYDKAWWSKEEKCWVNEKFHILESVTIFDRERRAINKALRPNDENAGRSYFVWNDKVFQSFQAENLKEIDLDIYVSLKSSISKRMYRFLDKRFYKKVNLEFDLDTFAFEHIGVSRSSSLSEVKRLLTKPILELEEIGFIKPLDKLERFPKIKKGIYKVFFERGQSEAKSLMSEEESVCLTELKSRGVTPAKASKLARSYSSTRVMEKIAIHDWMRSTGDKRCSQNPAGFLVNAIENDYAVPAGFLKSREQGRTELKVLQGNSRVVRVENKLKEEKPEAPSQIEVEFDLWWEAQGELEKSDFEAQAVEAASDFNRRFYLERKEQGGTIFKTVQRSILLEAYKVRVKA